MPLSSKTLKALIAVAICVLVEVLVLTLYVGYNEVDVTLSLVQSKFSPQPSYKPEFKTSLKRGKTSANTNYVQEEEAQFADEVTKMCSDKFSNFYDVLATMRVLIPTTFHPKFKNPCWYSNFRIPHLKGKVKKFYSKSVQLCDLIKFNKPNESKTLHCLPYFYIAGFPRSGTTALYSLISRHPQFTKPAHKEVHWLTRGKFNPVLPENLKSVMRYIYHFQHATREIEQNANLVTCDASASTLWHEFFYSPNKIFGCETPLLLSHVLPDAKYIVLLRNPLERLYSDFWYICGYRIKRNGPEIFHEAVQKSFNLFTTCQSHYSPLQCLHLWHKDVEEGDCDYVRLHASLYYLHIIKWLSVIPRKQFLFIKSEDLFHNPREILEKVLVFLDMPLISDQTIVDNLILKFTEGSNKNAHEEYHDQRMALLNETKILLGNFFQPYNYQLASLLQDTHFLWHDKNP